MTPLAGYLDWVCWLYEVAARLRALLWAPMYGRRARLTSIPEHEEEQTVTKWVPKQKHEVLKAKYKCLKKLFQVYDASLINILPDPYVKPEAKLQEEPSRCRVEEKGRKSTKKKRKTHRRKAEERSEDKTTTDSEKGCSCAAGALLKDLKIKKCTLGPTLTDQVGIDSKRSTNVKSIRATSSDCSSELSLSMDNRSCVNKDLNGVQSCPRQMQQYGAPFGPMYLTPPKLTKMQILKYRLFGHRPKAYRYWTERKQSLSDPTVSGGAPSPAGSPARPRRRLRLRRPRAKLVRSCDTVADMNHPLILGYVQSVQQTCLLDTTARHCPFSGCKMVLNGIINYNDHLRLCHFPERKFVCHYCHEGFDTEDDKQSHENEHIGIFKGPRTSARSSPPTVIYENFKKSTAVINESKDIQCDVISEEKLRKIVSYFDKISTGDGSFEGMQRSSKSQSFHSRCSTEKHFKTRRAEFRCTNSRSCGNNFCSSTKACDRKQSEHIAIACRICGQLFQFKHQLDYHVNSEHKSGRGPKSDSIGALPVKKSCHSIAKDGELNVDSIENCKVKPCSSDQTLRARVKPSSSDQTLKMKVAKTQSALSVDYDPSTNIVYYNTTSMESICKKASVFDKIVKRVKSAKSLQAPKWEQEVLHV